MALCPSAPTARPWRRDTPVLLDRDGTLVDSRAPFAHCLRGALAAAGRDAPPDAVLWTHLGPAIEHTLADLTGLASDAPQVLAIRDDYRARPREEGLALATVFDGVPAMLDALADLPLAVCTSKPESVARPVLEHVGLLDRFAVVGAPSPAAHAEPKTATMRRVLDALGRPSHATMVGDRIHDIEAARAHGLRAIGVAWWDNPHPGELARADAVAHRPADLPALVRHRA